MWYDGEYRCINAGKKLRELGKPEDGLRWFWDPVEASGLHDLIYIGYSSVTHAMVCALCERWHTETGSFHLPMGEMTITLDDVYNYDMFCTFSYFYDVFRHTFYIIYCVLILSCSC